MLVPAHGPQGRLQASIFPVLIHRQGAAGLEELLQTIKEILNAIGKSPRYSVQLAFERVEYRKTSGTCLIHFSTKAHLHPVEYRKLCGKVSREFERPGILISVSQKNYADIIETDEALMQSFVRDFLVYEKQAFLPFMSGLIVQAQGRHIELVFGDDFAYALFVKSGLTDRLVKYIKQCYGLEYAVQARYEESPQHIEIEYKPLFDVQGELDKSNGIKAHDAPSLSVPKDRPQARQQGRRSRPAAIKRTAEIREPAQAIDRLTVNEDCVIAGRIVYLEKMALKDGKYKHKFGLYDKTGTVVCWFIEKYQPDKPLESTASVLLEKDAWVKCSGSYFYDHYERDYAVSVSSLCKTEPVQKQDTSPSKRVELHLHTNMSAQDAVNDVKAYVKRAAEWGHSAIAITDHGVVQAFPDAAAAGQKYGVRVIYGIEAYLADDTRSLCPGAGAYPLDGEYIVFDIETTGLASLSCDITEIGAVRVRCGEVVDSFHTFVKPSGSIPPAIVALTGITNEMVEDAPAPQEALRAFKTFCANVPLVAHNASFDMSFIIRKGRETGVLFKNHWLDNIVLCRIAFPEMGKYKLNFLAKKLGIPLNHHRATDDALCAARIMLACFAAFKKTGVYDLAALDHMNSSRDNLRTMERHHIVLLCRNKTGLTNLYRLVSDAHVNHYYKKPLMLKSLIQKHREGLLVGSACQQGELYSAILAGRDNEEIKRIAAFYDYLEIQPLENNAFLIHKGEAKDEEHLRLINIQIYELGLEMGKPVVATGDVHFLEPEDEILRRIIFHTLGFEQKDQSPLYLRTTGEMLQAFSYLGKEESWEVVVENTIRIAEQVEEIDLFPGATAMPVVKGADEEILARAYSTAHEIYGDPLPPVVEERLKRELDSIITNGFGVLYWSAARLVKKSLSDGYLVGSRGSVGSSLAAAMTGITEVNPLPPHYVCPKCRFSDFDTDPALYACGVDLPPKECPVCGSKLRRDGYDIPFEVFLGINADKVPDIDLNFSGEYQSFVHKYTEELFGADNVFRAGTISSIKDKTAFGYVKKYMEGTNTVFSGAEIKRLVDGISGVKRTTGQHPGGMVIVPEDREIYEFTAVQKPADAADVNIITTHFDFNSMHDILVKLDILGHDVPTIIRRLQDITSLNPLAIPLDDPPTMALFSSLESLNLSPEQLSGIDVGTLGIPEFGTKFVRQMLKETKPTTMAELVRISGLSHGTDVWVGNAQDLIANGTATLKECICTRDDIMNYLISCGVEKKKAFFIMESVRKGNGLKADMETAMKEAGVPEWFMHSCKKIKYMFPKAHAVAYVLMSFRIAYCKLHYPEAFYATYFTVRSSEFDCSYVSEGQKGIAENIRHLEEKGKTATANEKNMITILEVANEMYRRGIVFLPVDIAKSDKACFLIENKGLRLPFISVPGLGENAAQSIVAARAEGAFISLEDLKTRCRLTNAVIEEMQKMGTLTGIARTNQISMFD